MKASCNQATLKSCQEEEEEEEEVEATAQEYSSYLFLARGQLWPQAQRGRDTHMDENTHSHTRASTYAYMAPGSAVSSIC